MNRVSLIGRHEESAKIDRFLETLREESHCLLLVGEVGIGKTTLLNWGKTRAHTRGFRLLSASPAESEVPLEFASLADLFEGVPLSVFDELPDPQRRAVGVAVFRDELPEEPVDPRTLATAMLGTFRRLAADAPVLLAIDDLPWLDAPSNRVLSYVLRRAGDVPIGLVGTVRTEWSRDRTPLLTDQVNTERMQRIRIGPMGEREIGQLLSDRAGLDLGGSKLKSLQVLCRGNPLFALELTEANTLETDERSTALMSVPKSLHRLVRGRIDHLSPASRDVLLTAALCAEPEFPVVEAAASDPSHAVESLERIVESGIVVKQGDDITFAHPLIRSVVIEDATAGDQRAAHRRLAMTVRGFEERARHRALGADGPSEKIAQEVEEAALAASARGACDTAAALAQMAASLTPPDQMRDQLRRVVLEAENRFDSLDPTRAIALLEEVVDAMPPGPGRGEILWRLTRFMTYRGDPMTTWIARLTEALEEAGDNLALSCAITTDLAVAATNAGDSVNAVRYGAQALEFAERSGDTAREAQLRGGMAFGAFCSGEGVRRDLVERALSGPEQPLRVNMELRPRFAIGLVLLMSDDLNGARTLFDQELKRAAIEGVDTGLPQLLSGLVETEAWAGNWERASELVTDGYRLAEDAGLSVMIGFMARARGLLHVYKGRIEEGRADGEKALAIGLSTGISVIAFGGAQTLGLAELSVGDAAAAHGHLGPISGQVLAAGVVEPGLSRFLSEEIEALIRLGDLSAAIELLNPFQSRSMELGRLWGMAISERSRGLLLAAAGDFVTASASLDRALEHHAGLGMPFEHGRTLLIAGEIHRRARRRTLADTHLRSAQQIFERLGAPLWVERARAEIDRLGLRRANSNSNLTGVETRVADLAATGLTNAQIATELFMSPRTVEAHLSRIYRKFGVRSRTAMSRAYLAQSPERT
jgi:DNA-binding CsgD family transcriptional regulator